MNPTQILETFDKNGELPNAAVFPFNRARTVGNLVVYSGIAIALVTIGLAARPSLNVRAGGVYYGVIGVWALLVLSSAWRAFNKAVDLKHASTNVLLITPLGVVQRLRGRVKSWLFSEYPELTIVRQDRMIQSIHLNRQGRTFDSELVDDGSFGPMADIAEALGQRGVSSSES